MYVLFPSLTQFVVNQLANLPKGRGLCCALWYSYDFRNKELSLRKALGNDLFHRKIRTDEKMKFEDQEDGKLLFIDISRLYVWNEKTGIQRRIINHIKYFMQIPMISNRYKIIYYDGLDQSYHYANMFMEKEFGVQNYTTEAVVFHNGDTLHFAQCAIPEDFPFSKFENHHVVMSCFIDDILPLEKKELNKTYDSYRESFNRLVLYCSTITSVSRTALEEIKNYIKHEKLSCLHIHSFQFCYSGCDFSCNENEAICDSEQQLISLLQNKTYVLSVSSIEPHKGYLLALKAFERLWKNNNDLSYVIVGKRGKQAIALANQIDNHPQQGENLFHFEGISDVMLAKLYKHSLFVLNCSEGEGFGLMSVEGAYYGKPILARDIPIFREVLHDQASFFPKECNSADLARYIEDCKSLVQSGKLESPVLDKIAYCSWMQSSEKMADILLEASTNSNVTKQFDNIDGMLK